MSVAETVLEQSVDVDEPIRFVPPFHGSIVSICCFLTHRSFHNRLGLAKGSRLGVPTTPPFTTDAHPDRLGTDSPRENNEPANVYRRAIDGGSHLGVSFCVGPEIP